MMAAATIVDGTFVDVCGENMHNIRYRMDSFSSGIYLRHLGSVANSLTHVNSRQILNLPAGRSEIFKLLPLDNIFKSEVTVFH